MSSFTATRSSFLGIHASRPSRHLYCGRILAIHSGGRLDPEWQLLPQAKLCTMVVGSCLSALLSTNSVAMADSIQEQGGLQQIETDIAREVGWKWEVLRLAAITDFLDDPVEPFTLYGSNFKKLFIEKLDDQDKVIARKRGCTVTTCIGIEPKSDETPEFLSLPLGRQAAQVPNKECNTVEGQDLESTCSTSCDEGCKSAVQRHSANVKQQLGFLIADRDKERVTKSCYKKCTRDCSVSGRTFSFFVPFRR